MRKFQFIVVLLLSGFLMTSCNKDANTTSGSGQFDTTAAKTATAASNNFDLLFEQTTQTCSDCGVWFDSAELVINHSAGTYTQSQSGGLLIKQSSRSLGRFRADLSSIPESASIINATLYMLLNRDEGIANADKTSVIQVYNNTSGGGGELVKTITAAGDIKGRGYSKANPNVPFDFTAYAQQVHGR